MFLLLTGRGHRWAKCPSEDGKSKLYHVTVQKNISVSLKVLNLQVTVVIIIVDNVLNMAVLIFYRQ